MYVLSWRTVSALTRVLLWYLFPSLLRNSVNKHQNNPLVSAETVRHSSTYIILYVNNREAGDLRCHRAHSDVIVMYIWNGDRTSIYLSFTVAHILLSWYPIQKGAGVHPFIQGCPQVNHNISPVSMKQPGRIWVIIYSTTTRHKTANTVFIIRGMYVMFPEQYDIRNLVLTPSIRTDAFLYFVSPPPSLILCCIYQENKIRIELAYEFLRYSHTTFCRAIFTVSRQLYELKRHCWESDRMAMPRAG